MNSKPFKMPHADSYRELEEALRGYYWLCFPELDEDELYDLERNVLVEVEQTVKRLYKVQP